MDPDTPLPAPTPTPTAYILSTLLVSLSWGLTTPFIRRAALTPPPPHPILASTDISTPYRLVLRALFAVTDLLSRPAYAIPFLLNITGSVWFFLLIGQAELSMTVPITNSLAFLFTVLGEWYVESKHIEGATWAGMALVLGGIAVCVWSKT